MASPPETLPDSTLPEAGKAPGGTLSLPPGGRVHGRYVIERSLGGGGMGSVFLATDTRVGGRVALKFINPGLRRNRATYQRLVREARVSLELKHPGIVRVHHLDEWDGLAYLVMDYLAGETLSERLKTWRAEERQIPWGRGRALVDALLDALVYTHEREIVHRDLKPSNIMLMAGPDDEERPVVLDFGLAKAQDDLLETRIGAMLGTPYYMAPEQIQGAEQADARADVYAVGVIAYEILTGELPRGTPKPLSEIRPDLPTGVDAWLARAMANDPAHRFQSAGEMRAAMPGAGEPTLAPAPESHGPNKETARPADGAAAAISSAGTGVAPERKPSAGFRRVAPWSLALLAALILAVGVYYWISLSSVPELGPAYSPPTTSGSVVVNMAAAQANPTGSPAPTTSDMRDVLRRQRDSKVEDLAQTTKAQLAPGASAVVFLPELAETTFFPPTVQYRLILATQAQAGEGAIREPIAVVVPPATRSSAGAPWRLEVTSSGRQVTSSSQSATVPIPSPPGPGQVLNLGQIILKRR